MIGSSSLLHKPVLIVSRGDTLSCCLAFCACTSTTIYQIFLGNENFLVW